MLKIINLVKNENMKLTRKISTWIMIGILILLVGIINGFAKHDEMGSTVDKDWKATATAQNVSIGKELKSPNVQGEHREYLEENYKTNQYRLEHNVAPIGDFSQWGMVGEMSGLISLIALFAIVLGGGIVANEFGEGTIKLLLIRPNKRWKILLSKYIAVVLMTLFMLLVLFVVSYIFSGVLFGFSGVDQTYLNYHNGVVEQTNIFVHVMKTYGLECVNLVMMVTLAFMISTVFRNSSLAIGTGVFLMFAGNIIVMLLRKYSWAKFILFANVDLSQYITGKPLISGMTMSFSIIVLAVYYIIFQLIAFLGFSKRDVAA